MGGLTTHFVFASVLTPSAPNAESRRGLGSHCVYPLKARMRNIQSGRGSITVVIRVDVCAGPPCKRVTNRHGEKCKTAVVRGTGTPERAERGRIPARPPRFLCWVSTVIVGPALSNRRGKTRRLGVGWESELGEEI